MFGPRPVRRAIASPAESKPGRTGGCSAAGDDDLLAASEAPFNKSDEGAVALCPQGKFFSGQTYYEDRSPGDATTQVEFR